jgi:hypothetical protein
MRAAGAASPNGTKADTPRSTLNAIDIEAEPGAGRADPVGNSSPMQPIGVAPVTSASVPPDDRFGPADRLRLLGVADTVTAVLDRLTGPPALRGGDRRWCDAEPSGYSTGSRVRGRHLGAAPARQRRRRRPRGWVEAAFPQFAQKWQRYAADQLADLRALPEYRQALVRHRCDAERCMARGDYGSLQGPRAVPDPED